MCIRDSLKVLACDLDGTLAHEGHVSTETWQTLRQAKLAGLTIILATGRILDSFLTEGPYAELFAAVVAEDGAVVYFPQRDAVMRPFGQLPSTVLERLEKIEVPMRRGVAIVATHVPHDKVILEELRSSGGGATVEYNRGAVMILPPGATKGTGLHYALRELGYSLVY
jgi:hydroxymethylpyrimidine pyrophosphatase-like HAD family hydrolase